MKYYAVFKKGIYMSWDDCKKVVHGLKGAKFKKFGSKEEAEFFVKYGVEKKAPDKKYITLISKKEDPLIEKPTYDESKIYVYTDGACSNNGKKNAKAGIGVFFGKDDPRNISKPLISPKQSNNIAELTAIIEAYQVLESEILEGKSVVIYSDSVYAMRCCGEYGRKRESEEWRSDFPNKDLVKKAYNIFSKHPNVEFRYIKAHTDGSDIHSIGNANADQLAVKGILMR
jgi:ribonuclease HI